MKQKIIIAGSNGFIGKYLVQEFEALHYEVLQISRNPNHIQWHETEKIVSSFENALAVINLAGKSVDCRYTEKNKKEILNSRIKTTQKIGDCINLCQNPPQIWMNSSTATIYRHETERHNTEINGNFGSGFSVDVAKNWEQAFFKFQMTKTRQIALRMSIVLGENGGALKPLIYLTKFGLGGRQGNGEQYFSWLHIRDLFSIILFCLENKNINGALNCTSPNAIKNKDLMKSLRQVLKMPFGIPMPAWLLKIGAVFIKTETELVLKSRWVYPEILLENGFKFEFEKIDGALVNLLSD